MPTAAPTTTDRPLDAEMLAIIARYRRTITIGAVILTAVILGSIGLAVLVSVRPGLVPNQGEAIVAAILLAVILVPCLLPLLVGTVTTLGRYAVIREAREVSGPLRVEQISLWGKLTQFDPELRGTNFDYLRIGDERVLVPKVALPAIRKLNAGTMLYTADGAVLFEVSGPDGTIAYRCSGYAEER